MKSYKDNFPKDLESDELTKYIYEGFDVMRKFRGEFMEKTLQLDLMLDEIISCYFSKERMKNEKFRKLILNPINITIHSKISILKKLELCTDEKYKDFIKRFCWFIESRNYFAHVPRDSYHPEFEFLWKGKKITKELNDSFFKELNEEVQYLAMKLTWIRHESNLYYSSLKSNNNK